MNKENVTLLAIETSCDETAAAVVRNGREVLSNVIYTQIALHTQYGGVVPEIASRKHVEKIYPVVEQAFKDADMTPDQVDGVAVTYGPGLVGPLLVGVNFAKSFAFAHNKPLVGVHHIEGHISANYIEHPDLEPPYMCLVVSGGHSHLVEVTDYGTYRVIARTRDDAAGEAFDKVARAIGLGYPGGPKIDAASREGDAYAFDFPKGSVRGAELDYSFSGLKSAVLNHLNSCRMQGIEINTADIAASFQRSVVEVLTEHSMKAFDESALDKFALAGGVASNTALRTALEAACRERGVKLYVPSPVYCTDNAAMIGAAGYYEFIAGRRDGYDLNAYPGLKLGS